MGPGQRLAIATHKVGERITDRDNPITIRWTSAHQGAEGNGAADAWAKAAVEKTHPGDNPAFPRETSLSRMTRATEARPQTTKYWIAEHVKPGRRYRPPKGSSIRSGLQRVRKALAGRYYQLLTGHAPAPDRLQVVPRSAPTCTTRSARSSVVSAGGVGAVSDSPGSALSLGVEPGQEKCGVEEGRGVGGSTRVPPPPEIHVFEDERTTEAVLTLLRDTKVGCMVSFPPRRRRVSLG